MVSLQPEMQQPSFDRLDFGRLRRLLAELGLQAGYWVGGAGEVKGLAPDVPLCRRTCAAGGHCQPFLVQLARDAGKNPDLHCRSCMPGAFSLATRLTDTPAAGPVVLGCFVTAAVQDESEECPAGVSANDRYQAQDTAWLTTAFVRIVRDWYLRSCERTREVEALSQSLADTYEELTSIYRLNETMNLTANPRDYFQEMAGELREMLCAEALLIRLLPTAVPGHDPQAATICAGAATVAADVLLAGIDMAELTDRGYLIRPLDAHGLPAGGGEATVGQLLLTPILRKNQSLGVIAALRSGGRDRFNNIDVTRASSIAKSIAVVVENFRLYDNLRQLFIGTVRALTRSIDAKDPYTCGHSERVATLARRLMLDLGGSAQQAERIYLSGLLHDIGKIGVPEAVLRKPGRLTDEEFDQIKRHPPVGAAILDGIDELQDVVPGVLHHHERIDGRGYPAGLVGRDIPQMARILAVADTFDAMTSARPYRAALSVSVAADEFSRHAGTQFDPDVVQVLLRYDLEVLVRDLGRIEGTRTGSLPVRVAGAAATDGGRP